MMALQQYLDECRRARRLLDESGNCRCRAYSFPHRAGGGRCRWPQQPATELVEHFEERGKS